jgi:pimeloyl-ACP methyl ester carboxylesterase
MMTTLTSWLWPRRTSAVLVGGFVLSSSGWAQAPARFHFEEKPGRYAVGLKVVAQYDTSRIYRSRVDAVGQTYVGERARPLQTLVWYPAQKSAAKPMTVGDYVQLLDTETDFSGAHPTWLPRALLGGMKANFADSLWAVRDAERATGRYPVVIYSPSLNAMSWENADLCEDLASHGYVVIATPSLGAAARNMTVDAVGIEAGARDISFLVGYARTLPDTNPDRVAVVGYSWGGMTALFAAARDNRISAIAELDGSPRYYPLLVKGSGDVHPEQMTIPMLYLTQADLSVEQLALYDGLKGSAPNVLNEWTRGDLIAVTMRGFVHREFSSMFQRDEWFWRNYEHNHVADYTRADGTVGYAWLVRYVLAFMESTLKGDAAATAFLKRMPSENGVPPNFISAHYRAAHGLPATMDALRTEAGRRGFDQVAAIYGAMKQQSPDFKPDAIEWSAWGHDLSDHGHDVEALAVLKLELQILPDARGVHAALGDVYVKLGQNDRAIENYKLELAKTPLDQATADKLKSLGKSGG